MKYIIKPHSDGYGFIVVHGEGKLFGCNAMPFALSFPTEEHAKVGIYVLGRITPNFFFEEYCNAVRIH